MLFTIKSCRQLYFKQHNVKYCIQNHIKYTTHIQILSPHIHIYKIIAQNLHSTVECDVLCLCFVFALLHRWFLFRFRSVLSMFPCSMWLSRIFGPFTGFLFMFHIIFNSLSFSLYLHLYDAYGFWISTQSWATILCFTWDDCKIENRMNEKKIGILHE